MTSMAVVKPMIMHTKMLESRLYAAALVKGCTEGEAVAREPLPVAPGMPPLIVPVAPRAPATLLLGWLP